MTYSSSAMYAQHVYQNSLHFILRQIIYVSIGTFVLFCTAAVPLTFWKNYSRGIILFSISLLVVVFMPVLGRTAGGAQRWIDLGVFNFQPAEFAKIAVCLYLTDYLARKKKFIRSGGMGVFVPPLILVGMICALCLLQPDLGSTAFIVMMTSLLCFLAGIRMRYVVGAALILTPAFYFLVMRVPYRLSRVTAYLNPWDDPQGSGFQIIQSFLAFGLGGIQGAGLGQGMQKLFYLPSSYNDFIFSVIGEELGLIGTTCVVLLYVTIFICGIRLSRRVVHDYEKLLVIALSFSIVLQAIIHMLVTTGLTPTKGLPLPFVSFGGTSMVFSLMAVGLILGIDRHASQRR